MYVVICIALCWIVLDIISGTIKAIKLHELDSKKMRDGLYHKVGYLLCICTGAAIDYTMVYVNIGFEVPVLEGTCVMVILTELISVAENIVTISPDLGDWAIFKNIRKKGGGEDERDK